MANRVRSRVLSIIGADSGAAPGKLSSTGQGRREARDSARSARAKDLERKAFRSELDKMMANKRAFDRADGDGSGLIDFHEFCGMDVNKGARWSELRMLFDSLDEDGNGVLDQEEFARYQEVLEEQALEHKAIFDRIDKNKSGTLDFEEVLKIGAEEGKSWLEMRELFDKIDVNRDGTIDEAEFAKFRKKAPLGAAV